MVQEFILYRKEIKAPMTEHAVKLLIGQLQKLSSDPDEQIEILRQSIVNGWKGIFSLKKAVKNRRRNRTSSIILTKGIQIMILGSGSVKGNDK